MRSHAKEKKGFIIPFVDYGMSERKKKNGPGFRAQLLEEKKEDQLLSGKLKKIGNRL